MKSLLKIAAIAAALSACTGQDKASAELARFKLASDGSWVQCKTVEISVCGAVLSGCSNHHKYYCLGALDVELVAADAPPPPPAPAPAPAPQPAPAPAPAPQK